MQRLTQHIKNVLQQAINVGGTTLRDFYAADGKPGYFSHAL
jgi:formamidopyrimidine-DNA glycosylase